MSRLERIVVVGAGLAGAAAAEELRRVGHAGPVVVVGDEKDMPYDRPPLSKTVVAGRQDVAGVGLPVSDGLDVGWRLGVAATGLDPRRGVVSLADGTEEPFDRVLIATGTRAAPWPDASEARLDGVLSVRGRADAAQLRSRIAAGVSRMVVVGGGFIGSEIASACHDIGVAVTVVDRGDGPMSNALGSAMGNLAGALQRDRGVDLRTRTGVVTIDGDAAGRVSGVHLDDGTEVAAEVVVTALGSRRNTEWLAGSGLAADRLGVTCDAALRAFSDGAVVEDRVWAAGDIARWPHLVYDGQLVAVEHWQNAVDQARHAARGMVAAAAPRGRQEPFTAIPRFWSNQFGMNLKSIGIPRSADTVQLVQGSVETGRVVFAYGRQGRLCAVVGINSPRELEGWEPLLRARAPFPPPVVTLDFAGQPRPEPVPVDFSGPDDEAPAHVVGPAVVDPLAVLGFPGRPGPTPRPDPSQPVDGADPSQPSADPSVARA